MLRAMILLAAGVLALAVNAAAAGEAYTDAANNFRVTVPDGWVNDHDTDEMMKLSVLSPRFADTRGLCGVLVMAEPGTIGKSQADLDADGDNAFGEEFWNSGFKKMKGGVSVTIDGHGVRMVNGHKAYVAAATMTGKDSNGAPTNAKTLQMIEVIPGQFFLVMCAALDSGFAREEADINALMDSFAPVGDVPVAMLAPKGVTSLTMYTQPRFGGVSRVVTQDAPNLGVFGWRGTTASMSIAGSGAWEVCEGTNFSGRCETITAALPTGPNGRGFTIASARHVKAMLPPPQSSHGDLSAGLTHLMTRVFAH